MIKSLAVLKNIPGHFEIASTSDSIIAALFNVLQPKIRSDIITMNVVSVKEYIYVYEKLNRYSE